MGLELVVEGLVVRCSLPVDRNLLVGHIRPVDRNLLVDRILLVGHSWLGNLVDRHSRLVGHMSPADHNHPGPDLGAGLDFGLDLGG